VSNLDTAPVEETCTASPQPGIQVLTARDVPLGGPRAVRVRRTLPQRQRSLIGAWCFVDHYGPHDVRRGPGMVVPPHPHTGLQTVSWLFEGEIEHRDSGGAHAFVHPGELNLMTAGAGICHSEVSTAPTTVLHGIQLWVALPGLDRDTARDFSHFVPQPVSLNGVTARIFLGELQGAASPVHTFTPLLGAQIDLHPTPRSSSTSIRISNTERFSTEARSRSPPYRSPLVSSHARAPVPASCRSGTPGLRRPASCCWAVCRSPKTW
jgi:redox-sensitive bicupin YhaK (pirin superfamily)